MADLHDLLVKTSRTFGLSIPFLPEPARREVTIAYLLFRIADTFEDADFWSGPRRAAALDDWDALLSHPSARVAERMVHEWLEPPPCDVPAYLELLAEVPFVLDALVHLPEEARRKIAAHALRTTRGMREYVSRIGEDGLLRVESVDDLRRYCYIVAGIVGEMLTDVFIMGHPPLAPRHAEMIVGSNRFGEGLQLVNILKDAVDDEKAGRVYLPPGADRVIPSAARNPEALATGSSGLGIPRFARDDTGAAIYAIARDGLEAGARYIIGLQNGGAPTGYMTFLLVPLFLGWATLELVERRGSGAKVPRELVGAVMQAMQTNFGDGAPRYTPADLRAMYEEITAAAVA